MKLTGWDESWPATPDEVDEWAISVASQDLDRFQEFDEFQVLRELSEAGYSPARAVEMMVADARVAFEQAGKSGFELEALTQGLCRCLEAEAARLDIEALPEVDDVE